MKAIVLTSALLAAGMPSGNLDVKEIDKSLGKISANLYASITEVTNSDYVQFIVALEESNDVKSLAMAKIDAEQWKKATSHFEPYAEHYSTHAAYQNYPVVNISHEGAKLYCKWLTNQYNKNPKRNFEKVVFRLPTEAEWIMAAGGGNTNAIYSWKGTGLKDKKGNIRSNFKRNKSNEMGQPGNLTHDADVTAPVLSYKPNGFGLYNMSGNVAEMLAEPGVTKGGSWMDTADFVEIGAVQSQAASDAPSPAIGFRYFMEVLEE